MNICTSPLVLDNPEQVPQEMGGENEKKVERTHTNCQFLTKLSRQFNFKRWYF